MLSQQIFVTYCAPLLLLTLICWTSPVRLQSIEYYTTRYDHLDVEAILNNRRMVNYYAVCLLGKGPCTPQGLEFKKILPEALRTNCLRCTEKQRTVTYRSIKRLQKEYPKIWSQLTELWDPDDVFVKEFEASFENQNSIENKPPVAFPDRFDNDVSSSDENQPNYPPPPVSSSSTTTTSTTTTTTTRPSTTTRTKPKTTPPRALKPSTNKPKEIVTLSPTFDTRVPTAFETLGTNIQATMCQQYAHATLFKRKVSLVQAIKKFAFELYRHKLEHINRVLSGR